MAGQSSMPPPPQGGGGAKYLLVLLILIAGGLGLFFAFRAPDAATVAAPPQPEPPKAERSTALANDTLEIPEPALPDAGTSPVAVVKKPARPAGDQWACEGDVPATDIKRVLSDSQTQVRSCYERRLRNNNMLQGTVNLQVKIGNTGKVNGTRIRGTLQDAEVKACVQSLAKNWNFPAPTGGACAVFDAPYTFTPKN